MQRVNLNTWLFIGSDLSRAEHLKPPVSLIEAFSHLIRIETACQDILEQEVPRLDWSVNAGRELLEATKKAVVAIEAQITPENRQTEADEGLIQNISSSWVRFRSILQEDLSRKNIYAVRESEIYSVSSLIENGDAIIPQNLRANLPDPCLVELKQAGRCLAFDLPTASAFHIMRAIEVVLLEYWDIVTRQPRPDNRNWGVLLNEIGRQGGDKAVISAVNHVKDLHRNPIIHPEITLSMDDALVLWHSAPAAIVALNRDILNRRSAVPILPERREEQSPLAHAVIAAMNRRG